MRWLPTAINAKPGAALDRASIAEVALEQGKFKPEDADAFNALRQACACPCSTRFSKGQNDEFVL